MEVFGGIAAHTTEEFSQAVHKVVNFVDGIHVDFADGVFVPNTMLALEEVPLMQTSFAEAHLMVKDPLRYFDLCAQKAFRRVIFHATSLSNCDDTGVALAIEHGKSLGLQVGVAIELDADLPSTTILSLVDSLTVMTVKLGFAGGEFDPRGLAKARELLSVIPHLPIEIDGGVSDVTIASIRSAGVPRVVSTSWLQQDEHTAERVEQLRSV